MSDQVKPKSPLMSFAELAGRPLGQDRTCRRAGLARWLWAPDGATRTPRHTPGGQDRKSFKEETAETGGAVAPNLIGLSRGARGRLYAAGGEYQDTARKMTFWAVEVFYPATGIWSVLPHMLVARHGFAAALLGDQLHVIGGGFQSDGIPSVEVTMASHEVIDLGAE